ncbi:hypothetical protein ACHQM5_006458 [Ranunculus cassubicifolius]
MAPSTAPTTQSSSSPKTYDIPDLDKQLKFVTVKLDDENFLIWKKQIFSILKALEITEYLDSTVSPPDAEVLNTETNTKTPNPSYLQWRKSDQTLLTFLQATFSIPLLARTPTFDSSLELFTYLENAFTAQISSRTHQLLTQLQQIQRGTKSINDYLANIKQLSDSLAYTPTPVSDPILVQHTLRGLGSEYDQFVTAIETREKIPSFAQLYPLLLNHEVRLLQSQTLSLNTNQSSALLARTQSSPSQNQTPTNYNHNPTNNFQRGGRRGGRNNGRGGYGRNNRGGGRHSNRGNFNGGYNQNNNFYGQQSVLGAPPVYPGASSNCQVCGQPTHSALQCPHRFNHSYQAMDLPQSFAAMQLNATPYDQHWYPDSGATHHMTADDGQMYNQAPYQGTEHVAVGNGNRENSSQRTS